MRLIGQEKYHQKAQNKGENQLPMQSYTLTTNGDRCWSYNIERHSQEWQKAQERFCSLGPVHMAKIYLGYRENISTMPNNLVLFIWRNVIAIIG